MTALRDEPCVVPVMDTWRNWDRAGSWLWSPRIPWNVDQLAAVLEVLHPIARTREALLGGPPDAPPLAMPERVWHDGVAHAVFERSLVEAARTAAVPITTIDLVLDLRVWVRTATTRTMPVLGWVRSAAEVSLYFAGRNPYGALVIHHTLFIDGKLAGDPNIELHRLNQPLLRDVLAAIESRFGPIIEVEGLPGVSPTGFTSSDS